ncbi:pseudouridine synthase [Stappia sp.]|uniref:pseudouridine synthase n=1 Tax=Stappia sp. TaxID=1870903 RepID=UPI0032D910D9
MTKDNRPKRPSRPRAGDAPTPRGKSPRPPAGAPGKSDKPRRGPKPGPGAKPYAAAKGADGAGKGRGRTDPGRPGKGQGKGAGQGPARGPGKGTARDRSAADRPAKRPTPAAQPLQAREGESERVAKVIARAGLCSRRTAESWIIAGRVAVNGTVLTTPAVTVTPADTVTVDGTDLPERERTRLWLYHKPRGLVTTNHDPEGRPTVFDRLPPALPRVVTIGRLDINTEGLLLLTNDGGLSRVLELPATGWLRRYRVRAYGKVTQAELDALADGIAIDGVLYGAIEAAIDKEQGDNIWLTIALREGKNREIKRVLEHLGLSVNRLIRISFGPFQLADLAVGEVREIRGRVLRDQLGDRLADEAGVDFDAPLHTPLEPETPAAKPARPQARPAKGGGHYVSAREARDTLTKRSEKRGDKPRRGAAPAAGKPGRGGKTPEDKPAYISPRSRFRFTSDMKPRPQDEAPLGRKRRIWDEDGSLVEDRAPPPEDAGKGRGGPPARGGPARGGPARSGQGGRDRDAAPRREGGRPQRDGDRPFGRGPARDDTPRPGKREREAGARGPGRGFDDKGPRGGGPRGPAGPKGPRGAGPNGPRSAGPKGPRGGGQGPRGGGKGPRGGGAR